MGDLSDDSENHSGRRHELARRQVEAPKPLVGLTSQGAHPPHRLPIVLPG